MLLTLQVLPQWSSCSWLLQSKSIPCFSFFPPSGWVGKQSNRVPSGVLLWPIKIADTTTLVELVNIYWFKAIGCNSMHPRVNTEHLAYALVKWTTLQVADLIDRSTDQTWVLELDTEWLRTHGVKQRKLPWPPENTFLVLMEKLQLCLQGTFFVIWYNCHCFVGLLISMLSLAAKEAKIPPRTVLVRLESFNIPLLISWE